MPPSGSRHGVGVLRRGPDIFAPPEPARSPVRVPRARTHRGAADSSGRDASPDDGVDRRTLPVERSGGGRLRIDRALPRSRLRVGGDGGRTGRERGVRAVSKRHPPRDRRRHAATPSRARTRPSDVCAGHRAVSRDGYRRVLEFAIVRISCLSAPPRSSGSATSIRTGTSATELGYVVRRALISASWSGPAWVRRGHDPSSSCSLASW